MKSIQNTYELAGQKGSTIPDTVNLMVQDDQIAFNNISRRTWSEMVAKMSYLKRTKGNSDMTTKAILHALKEYCVDGKKSN